jgi:hypothetical protein
MGLRIGFGVRLGRHVYIGASVPLGHARHVVRHQGHAEPFDPIRMLLGAAFAWVFLRTFWGLAWGN